MLREGRLWRRFAALCLYSSLLRQLGPGVRSDFCFLAAASAGAWPYFRYFGPCFRYFGPCFRYFGPYFRYFGPGRPDTEQLLVIFENILTTNNKFRVRWGAGSVTPSVTPCQPPTALEICDFFQNIFENKKKKEVEKTKNSFPPPP